MITSRRLAYMLLMNMKTRLAKPLWHRRPREPGLRYLIERADDDLVSRVRRLAAGRLRRIASSVGGTGNLIYALRQDAADEVGGEAGACQPGPLPLGLVGGPGGRLCRDGTNSRRQPLPRRPHQRARTQWSRENQHRTGSGNSTSNMSRDTSDSARCGHPLPRLRGPPAEDPAKEGGCCGGPLPGRWRHQTCLPWEAEQECLAD